MAIRASAALISYFTFVILARWMDAVEYGRLAFGFSLAMTVSLFAALGQPRLVLRFLGEYAGTGRPDLVRALMRFASSRIVAGAIAGGSVLTAAWLFQNLNSASGHQYLLPTAVLAAFLAVAEFQAHVLRGIGSVVRALAPKDIVWRPSALAVIGAAVASPIGATAVLTALTATLGAILLVQYVAAVRPALHVEYPSENDEPHRTVTQTVGDHVVATPRRVWQSTGLNLWLASALNPALQHVTVLIVGLTLTPIGTGAFFAALKTAAIITFPLQAVNIVVAPLIARSYSAQDHREVQRLCNLSALTSSCLALAGYAVLVFFGGFLLSWLFGQAFVIARPALHLMATGFLISALSGSSAYLLTMTGHDRLYLRILFVNNLFAIVLIAVMSSILGLAGAAIGFAFGTSAWNIVVFVWARRSISIDPSIMGFILPPGPKWESRA